MPRVTRAKGGTAECVVDAQDIEIPDLWHVVQELRKWPLIVSKLEVDEILETWQLCHDLKRHALDQEGI